MTCESSSFQPPSRDEVIAKADELGFSRVGFAPAELPALYRQAFERWLARGMHADMHWIATERHRAREAHDLLPDAKSVLVLALEYAQNTPKSEQNGTFGLISSYARGRDYHKAFRTRQKKLLAWLSSYGGTHIATVDSRPLFERAYAREAGLGFIGKNTCLIHPERGSFLFLGTVVSSFAWPPDAPLELDCRDCRRCLDACPTGALQDAYVLDARRCINYLTIEYKGEISPELARKMGTRLFGCDTCQQVCPHNRDVVPTLVSDFARNRLPAWISLDDIDALTDDDAFRQRFAGTALMRIDLDRLRRNARIVRENAKKTTI